MAAFSYQNRENSIKLLISSALCSMLWLRFPYLIPSIINENQALMKSQNKPTSNLSVRIEQSEYFPEDDYIDCKKAFYSINS